MRFTRKTGISIFLLLFLIVIGSFVSAEDTITINQYATYSDFYTGAYVAQPDVCVCGSKIDTIFIKNTGSFHSIFNLTSNNKYVTLPFSSVELAPNQEITADLLLAASCDASQGLSDYIITISNNYGKTQEISRSLEVNECQTISAELFANKNEINPCGSVNYTLNITNPAPFTENYVISPLIFSEFFSYPEYVLSLQPGQSGFVQTTFNPSCDIYGNKSLSFEIYAEKSGLKAELTHNLNIKQNYSFDIYGGESADLCQYTYSGKTVVVKNTAGIPMNYSLTLINAPIFASLNQSYLEVLPGQNKSVYLNLEPGDGSKGLHSFELEIKTTVGDTSLIVPINMSVSECYDVSLKIINPFKTCAGDSSFDMEIINNGKYDETVLLASNEERIVVSQKEVSVASGETKTISLTSSVIENESKVLIPFTISATLKDRSTWLSWQDNAQLEVYEQHTCTYPSAHENKVYARYNSTSKNISFTNEGLESTTYLINYAGSSWINISDKELTLLPGETGDVTLNLYADSSEVQKTYYFDINLTSKTNNVSYTKSYELIMTNVPFTEKLFAYLISTTCTFVSAVLIILLILAIIFLCVARTVKLGVSGQFRIVLGVLILLVVLVTLFVFGVPKSIYPALDNDKVDNPLYLIWYQDHSFSLDLSKYFADPDGDVLNFSVQEMPNNMTVSVKGVIVSFEPDAGWNGTARAKFSAVDEGGDEVISPSFDIEVVAYDKLSLEEIYFKYCPYINAVLLIILLLLLIFLPGKNKKEKKVVRKKPGKVSLTKVKREKGYLYFVDKEGDISRTKVKKNKK
ncbi:hypothetical protein COV13_02810 [Candidatus Woesearchaeota archaeon CG10_big_fil_rev_8_21_14_0_10_32_9]|nr:MAG: hypothetical protein COV13_02810 [Candidatus Woesearchaeota archaeon CG10_big_fil_rev_8_21_14_0_10_32_9]